MRAFAALALAGLLLGACTGAANPTASPTPPISPPPSGRAVGGYLLTTEPQAAPFDLTFRHVDRAGLSEAIDHVATGATTEILRASFAGAHRMMMNGVSCDGTFEVKDGIRTLIVVTIGSTTECTLAVVGEEPYE